MSMNAHILQSIQKAGQSIHDSRELLKAEVARFTENLIGVMGSQPLGPLADSAFGQLKLVARMHQEMQALEEQLRGIYQSATQLKASDVQIIEALPHRQSIESSYERVEDANVVAPVVRRKPGRKPSAKPVADAVAVKRRGGRVSANDDKVLAALRRLLKIFKNTTLPQAQIAAEAGIPVGSIAASLHRLQDAGRVVQKTRGQYRLT
jgi:predicted Rossmann fold nucleotide-binding protein DprA/Smf involved in DNA uptake